MILPETERKRVFELLDRFGEMDDDELLDHFTDKTVASLRLLLGELNENMRMERILSENRFVEVIRELVEIKNVWSGRLMEVQGHVEQAIEKGGKDQAVWLLNGFIRFCPSPHYRRAAEGILERI